MPSGPSYEELLAKEIKKEEERVKAGKAAGWPGSSSSKAVHPMLVKPIAPELQYNVHGEKRPDDIGQPGMIGSSDIASSTRRTPSPIETYKNDSSNNLNPMLTFNNVPAVMRP